ncbi:serine protease inhibitor Kazal-type 2 isoform X1 [Tamandua tetradactyla]|uniref:serine protease inhibitor Kazal-type 2 isoform X1 n=1 Tax=Tamandua tetradactyla TaxID=48850 RepID=UPI00405445CC
MRKRFSSAKAYIYLRMELKWPTPGIKFCIYQQESKRKVASLDSVNLESAEQEEYRSADCDQYRLPGCPRDFSPVCGSDMATYPNECILCLKIREEGHDIKIVRSEPC